MRLKFKNRPIICAAWEADSDYGRTEAASDLRMFTPHRELTP